LDKVEFAFATRNLNKLKEIRTIFKDSGFKILSLEDFPEISSWQEDGESFTENAWNTWYLFCPLCRGKFR
jgi:inosine/xanthosine triphosphate pyrophosphatase family protein